MFIFPNTRLLVFQTLQPVLKDFTTLNTITDVRLWCNKRAVVQKPQLLTQINGWFVDFPAASTAKLLIVGTVNIGRAGKQNLQRLAESLVGYPPTYLHLSCPKLIHYAWIQEKLNLTKGQFIFAHQAPALFNELTWSQRQDWKKWLLILLPPLLPPARRGFTTANQAGKATHQGFPLVKWGMVEPARKSRGRRFFSGHTHQTRSSMSWLYGEGGGSWDSG